MTDSQKPYLEETVTTIVRRYNPYYGDDRICQCGHTYYRHFDSWENMANVGCKYCWCHDFQEADMSPENIERMREIVRRKYPQEDIEHFINSKDDRDIESVMEFYFLSLYK